MMPPLGRVGGRTALFLMAAVPEYGPALAARITPVMTGIGPVEAALATAAALARLDAAGRLPGLAVCLGSAGSRVLPQGAIYQVSTVSYRDMDVSPLGFPRGVTPLSGLPAELPLLTVPGLPAATLSTGAAIVSGPGYDDIPAQMVDMETWAVARACMTYGVPLIGLRGISDGAEPLGGMTDWTRYLDIIDTRLAEALDAVEAAMAP